MNLSYWEHKTWLSNIDFTIVGSGIVGLNCAIHLKELFPKAKVLILEKGILPQGASTKNAGFACFGSISEVLSDLTTHSEEEVHELVLERWNGIHFLRSLLGDQKIGFQRLGGHELFLEADGERFEKCVTNIGKVNQLLEPIFGEAPFVKTDNVFHFGGVFSHYVTHRFEGQIDTGRMMASLLSLASQKGIRILNNITVKSIEENGKEVLVSTDQFDFKTNHVMVATNGFASQLLGEEVEPARAQVLITEPIENLHIKGTFHLDEGYYYFRNIDNRILLGGGRNLDFKGEQTTSFGQTDIIQKQLEHYLKALILPNKAVKISGRWSGIMGVGSRKKPIVKQVSNHIFCGVRLGGMGVAIGSHVGRKLAQLPKFG